MRPTSIASTGQAGSAPGGRAAAFTAVDPIQAPDRGSGRGLGLRDEALHRRRHLRAGAGPVLDAVERDAQRLLATRGDRVVETHALDEAAIASGARVGDDDVEERALL